MFLRHGSRALRAQWHLVGGGSIRRAAAAAVVAPGGAILRRRPSPARSFHASRSLQVVKPVLLADIGEGIVECEIIQWFVEPEARVEEFSPLCEVQSDKASVEITSRFSGVVKRLYYEAGEMAKVGKPFVDIDIQGDVKREDLEALTEPGPEPAANGQGQGQQQGGDAPAEPRGDVSPSGVAPPHPPSPPTAATSDGRPGPEPGRGRFATLATPAVRHLSKEFNVDISQIPGTGKDGRVLKEDIYKFIQQRDSAAAATTESPPPPPSSENAPRPPPALQQQQQQQTETTVQLTNTQLQMFKTMTRSLAIPHFLYADEIDFTKLFELRTRLNKVLAADPTAAAPTLGVLDGSPEATRETVSKLSYLPFIIKAVSIALQRFPVLNARVDYGNGGNGGGNGPNTSGGSAPAAKPSLVYRSQHNIGVAVDTPAGLVVPVVKNVGARSVLSIAAELARLQAAARASKLSPADMSGGTITVSNIGSIGGTYLSPVVVEREVAILGVGRVRAVPAFADEDGSDRIVRRHVCNFSYSADHRVIDGATLARAAGVVRQVVEEPDVMIMQLR